jgi:hypothetical protein
MKISVDGAAYSERVLVIRYNIKAESVERSRDVKMRWPRDLKMAYGQTLWIFHF